MKHQIELLSLLSVEPERAGVNPFFFVCLIGIAIFAGYLKFGDTNRQYSTTKFWQNATIESVEDIPSEALASGNQHGSVLMWAAIGTDDPAVLRALVARDVDVNEPDVLFKGTPLTGAASYSKHPLILETLIELGAKIDQTVHHQETALMIAAQFNANAGITSVLLKHGANRSLSNASGQTALDLARLKKNTVAILELTQ